MKRKSGTAYLSVLSLMFLFAGAIASNPSLSSTAPTSDGTALIKDAKGCGVPNPHPLSDETITWSGACKSGLVEGKGTLQWFKNGVPSITMRGEFKDGLLSGQGTVSRDGKQFEGQFLAGKYNGHGHLSYPDGASLEGEWLAGDLLAGTLKYSSGAIYVGDFKNNKRFGHGILTEVDGTKLTGEWVDDALTGYGSIVKPNGDKVRGELKNAKLNGFGSFDAASGAHYEGNYKDGVLDGYGKTTEGGVSYEGYFVNGVKQGHGRYTDAHGTYDGGFLRGKPDGHGIITYLNGTTREVDYRDGQLVAASSSPAGTDSSSPGFDQTTANGPDLRLCAYLAQQVQDTCNAGSRNPTLGASLCGTQRALYASQGCGAYQDSSGGTTVNVQYGSPTPTPTTTNQGASGNGFVYDPNLNKCETVSDDGHSIFFVNHCGVPLYITWLQPGSGDFGGIDCAAGSNCTFGMFSMGYNKSTIQVAVCPKGDSPIKPNGNGWQGVGPFACRRP